MYRTDEGRTERRPGVIAPPPGAGEGPESGDDWLTTLLASEEVSVCVLEVFRDANCADYRFISTSPAFERSTGLHGVAGRCMRELRADHEEFWYDLYEQVAETGEPACFEHMASALERRYRGHAFRIGRRGAYQVVVIFAVTLDTGEESFERFVATVAHELRSPLASMSNGLQVLKQSAPEGPGSQRTISMMERQVVRLSGLIDDMLDIGRLGFTDVRLQRELIDLHQVIAESVEACGAAIAAKRHEVMVDSDGAPLQVRADRRRLVQVFSNLLTNSIKYTPPGGHIRFKLFREGEMAVTEVHDDGMGIPAEELAHVFDLYNQVPAHQLQAGGGLGIGLTIVRSIVRLHGGTVAAHSDGRQKGSTFTVRLPLSS